ncbi:MAG: TetR/AcrR family transcriptional regulator [Caulobacteraceae bacterium]
MGVREDQKQATRRRVLDSARDLFDEVGFEDTTIRTIAERAGVSVGSVFTTFASKQDILSQVMLDRLEPLYEELERTAPLLRGSAADRLRSFFAIHYAFETRRVKLFLAHIAASYNWKPATGTTPYGRNVRLKGMLANTLRDAIAQGECRPDVDIDMVIDSLMAAYAWNYRRVLTDGADDVQMTALMDGQIGLLFDGLRPRA